MFNVSLIWKFVLERINEEHENKVKELEEYWQNEVSELRSTVEQVKEQMERDAQQKIECLIQQHRDELSKYFLFNPASLLLLNRTAVVAGYILSM